MKRIHLLFFFLVFVSFSSSVLAVLRPRSPVKPTAPFNDEIHASAPDWMLEREANRPPH